MKEELFPEFIKKFEAFKNTEDYTFRLKQLPVAQVFKEIIIETLKNEPLKNEHLTGLIQMFKYDCTNETFDKYLMLNVADSHRRKELSDKFYEIDQRGYTGAGRNAITALTPSQLARVKKFLLDAFQVKTIEEAVKLCTEFDKEHIPYVTSGVYSPWLYYINPTIFPICNNSHKKFREWIEMEGDYPSCIKDFNALSRLIGEDDLGLIDYFAHTFGDKPYPPTPDEIKVLNLKGKRLYKMSHGIFLNVAKFKKQHVIDVLEKNNWISLHKNTGKGAAKNFMNTAGIGDYVYICYGSINLYCIGKIVSEVKPFKFVSDNIEDGWIYREIEPLFFPEKRSIRELKDDRRFFMPSGNSTFYEVPKNQLDYLNDKIFIPKFDLKIVDDTISTPNPEPKPEPEKENNEMKCKSMNTILYGPPGTGKTYKTAEDAVKIIDGGLAEKTGEEKDDVYRKRIKGIFARHQKDKRIFFTTFHQNMAYEDFIEGIKPVMLEEEEDDHSLKYTIQDGLFMQACVEAAFDYIQSNFKEKEDVKELLDFNELYDQLLEEISNAGSKNLKTKRGGEVTASVTSYGNFSIKHLESEKLYTVSKNRLSKLYEAYPNPDKIENIVRDFRKIIGGSNATAYWSVLNAITEIRDEQGGEIRVESGKEEEIPYEDKRDFVQKYWNKKEYVVLENDHSHPYVFIIDEINRGNVAQIFGELITLIEEDKRMGKMETIYAELPYSKNAFAIPPNLYIIGTMNTADRSVEALDTALRRRFSFDYLGPKPGLLNITEDGINLPEMLKVINKRLEVLKDPDHTLGHAWFWDVKNVEQLKIVFKDKVLPLLQEYFYNDYEKLGLVLGDAFFDKMEQVNPDMFAAFDGGTGLAGQYDQAWQYKLKPANELTVDIFKTLEQQTLEPETYEEE